MDGHVANLIESLGSDSGAKRKRAREMLALIGEQATPFLRDLLSNQDKRLRWEAAKALAAIIDPASLGSLVAALGDQHSDVRWLAGSGLINLGPRSVAPVLQSLVENPQSTGHQQAGHRILRALSAENDVLGELLRSLVDALDSRNPAVIASQAAAALNELERIQDGRVSL